jgi:hypothetical protein
MASESELPAPPAVGPTGETLTLVGEIEEVPLGAQKPGHVSGFPGVSITHTARYQAGKVQGWMGYDGTSWVFSYWNFTSARSG